MVLPVGTASAHAPLPEGKYKCYENGEQSDHYTHRDLHIRAEKRYAFKKASGELVGNAGDFRHPSDNRKIRFTSGYLHNKGWTATHTASDGLYIVYLERVVDGNTTQYHCSPQFP